MTDHAGPTGLELLQMFMTAPKDAPNIGNLLGFTYEKLEFGEVSFSIATRPDFANPLGSVHGGICATLLDSVMGCAVHSTLGPGIGYSTLEIKVNYIRTVPTDGRKLIGTGKVVHAGRSTATAEGKVVDEDGRLVAHASTTCLIHTPK
ncbi:PaaI family thioesterase [Smaragdicoccus niigatensis]|uniref:PaaI family thioesterase n=1 Tax=Smaragdicoccus niigatensis TaxID=359359 RepID=UPI00035FFE6A